MVTCIICGATTVRADKCRKCYCKEYVRSPRYKSIALSYRKSARGKAKRKAEEKKNRTSFKGRFRKLNKQARQRNLEVSITFEQFVSLVQPNKCHYCNGPLSLCGSGIDRINNASGYSLKNVLPCCGECNRIKSNRYTVGETTAMVSALKEYRKVQ